MDVVRFSQNSIRSVDTSFIHSLSSVCQPSLLLRGDVVAADGYKPSSCPSHCWDLLTQPPMLDVGLNTLQLSYLSRAQQNE